MAKATFALYTGLGTLATPLVRGHLRRRTARGREDPVRIGERFGRAGSVRPPGPLVWVHGASVGESLSVLPLVGRIRADWPPLNVLVTTGTVTSARLMAERLPSGVIHQYAPVDLPAAVDRFLDHWRPDLGLIVESEFWPNLLLQARVRGVELALVNGRISANSYASWRRMRPVIGHLLGQFSVVLAQSREDEAHLRELGATDAKRLGNLKFAAPPLSCDEAELAALRAAIADRPRWLAASTHPGEDEIAAEAHAAITARHPGLLTILVPRHPQRGTEVAGKQRAAGYRVALRSTGEAPGPDTEFYIADTIGELGLWYRLADVVFVGGSLVPKGGQNLLEPAKLGCAIVCGPHMTNFLRVSEEMTRAGAARRVTGSDDLAAETARLLGDRSARQAMIAAAQDYATAQAGVLDDIAAALKPQLDRAVQARP